MTEANCVLGPESTAAAYSEFKDWVESFDNGSTFLMICVNALDFLIQTTIIVLCVSTVGLALFYFLPFSEAYGEIKGKENARQQPSQLSQGDKRPDILEFENAILKQENERLKQSQAGAAPQSELPSAEIAKMAAEMDSLQRDLAATQEQANKQNEVDRLQRNEVANLAEENVELRGEIDRLKKQNAIQHRMIEAQGKSIAMVTLRKPVQARTLAAPVVAARAH